MKKVLDKELEVTIEAEIKLAESPAEAAHNIVEGLRKYQDAGGMKVCQNKTWK